jgi:hypothetical protein
MYRSHDPNITILPWTKASPGQPIGKAADIPKSVQGMQLYSSGLKKPQWGSKSWCSLHFTYKPDGSGLATFPSFDGVFSSWFVDHKHTASLHTVHDSEMGLLIGIFRFSGPFINLRRFEDHLHQSYQGHSTVVEGSALGKFKMGRQLKQYQPLSNLAKEPYQPPSREKV